MDFYLFFTPRNILPSTGLIRIVFPPIYQLVTIASTREAIYGFEHKARLDTVRMGPSPVTAITLEISNFYDRDSS